MNRAEANGDGQSLPDTREMWESRDGDTNSDGVFVINSELCDDPFKNPL